jgi:glycosyltransferase involved in cell wall biosynthesis
VLEDPELAATLAAAAARRAERYRWEVVAADIEAAYADAVSAAQRRDHGRPQPRRASG